jgi:hypothetical protein
MYRSANLFLSLFVGLACLSCSAPEPEDAVKETSQQGTAAAIQHYLESDWISGGNGPWGTLEYRRYFLSLPKTWSWEGSKPGPVVWQVADLSAAKVNELIAASPLTELEKALWKSTCRVEDTASGALIHPSSEFRWALLPQSRSMLYNWLATHPGNTALVGAFQYPSNTQQEWLQNSNLRAELTQGIKHFLYPSGAAVKFADWDLLDEFLASDHERTELMNVLCRQPYCELRLRLDQGSDLDKLAEYWGEWDRVELVRQVFKKTLGHHKYAYLPLAEILPSMPRRLLNTFPALSTDTVLPKPNCSWTAFNFFNRTPDQRFCDAGFVVETVRSYHDEISDDPHYGDILLLTDKAGQPVHAAVYLAGDFVFTKNGGHLTKPWAIMRMDDMKAVCPQTAVKTSGYRWNPEKDQQQYHLSNASIAEQ